MRNHSRYAALARHFDAPPTSCYRTDLTYTPEYTVDGFGPKPDYSHNEKTWRQKLLIINIVDLYVVCFPSHQNQICCDYITAIVHNWLQQTAAVNLSLSFRYRISAKFDDNGFAHCWSQVLYDGLFYRSRRGSLPAGIVQERLAPLRQR